MVYSECDFFDSIAKVNQNVWRGCTGECVAFDLEKDAANILCIFVLIRTDITDDFNICHVVGASSGARIAQFALDISV